MNQKQARLREAGWCAFSSYMSIPQRTLDYYLDLSRRHNVPKSAIFSGALQQAAGMIGSSFLENFLRQYRILVADDTARREQAGQTLKQWARNPDFVKWRSDLAAQAHRRNAARRARLKAERLGGDSAPHA